MAILVNKDTKVLVQGITGRSGALQTKVMLEYGTQVVAGVTPGKAGQRVHGVPVYDLVADAVKEHKIDAAISFVPPPFAKDACLELIEAGIEFLVLTTEGIPDHDVVEILAYARVMGTRILGPGTAGVIAPGKCKLGAHPPRMYREGRVGLVSKSVALSYEVGKTLTEAGIGQSTVLAIGGGPIWGLTQRDVLRLFQEDEETDIIVLLGEIGGSMEEEAAELIATELTKPVVAMIVGRAAPPGKSLGHAGAIIEGNRGTAQAKIAALNAAGAHIAKTPQDILRLTTELRGGRGDSPY
ncbi:MAG: succinate--CoA ligase subunit alpha, partial [Firmicutes bacterium]|nr:succinate--CoA ligase subunit alpha [Bacillota bacterium]